MNHKDPVHWASKPKALYNMTQAYGFSGPTDTDSFTMTPEREDMIYEKLVEYKNIVDPTKTLDKNNRKKWHEIIVGVLTMEWEVFPKKMAKSDENPHENRWKLVNTKKTSEWPEHNYNLYEHFKQFASHLHEAGKIDSIYDNMHTVEGDPKSLQYLESRDRFFASDGTETDHPPGGQWLDINREDVTMQP